MGIAETVDWWHRRRQRGTHHPCTPAARMVWEIVQRLQREAARQVPPRSIVVQRRASPGPEPGQHQGFPALQRQRGDEFA